MKEKTVSTGTTLTSTHSVATSGVTLIGPVMVSPPAPGRPLSSAKIESAVYSYIRAVRALGKKRVSTAEIAAALKLSEAAVRDAASSLTSKGVRAAE